MIEETDNKDFPFEMVQNFELTHFVSLKTFLSDGLSIWHLLYDLNGFLYVSGELFDCT